MPAEPADLHDDEFTGLLDQPEIWTPDQYRSVRRVMAEGRVRAAAMAEPRLRELMERMVETAEDSIRRYEALHPDERRIDV